MISSFAFLSILVTTGALFSLLSVRALRLPTTVGTMLLSLIACAVLIGAGGHAPALRAAAEHFVGQIDFNRVVLHGALAFLLFAGALQLDLEQLSQQRLPVLLLSVLTTALSTVMVAALLYGALSVCGIHIEGAAALLFGALISPTDPVAVLDTLRRAKAPPALELQLAGESLFNDGVGAVIFLALVGASADGSFPTLRVFGGLLLIKAGGGIALGAVLGYVTYRLLRTVDDYKVEVLMTLALAMGGYAMADALRVSAPLEVVTAGLLVNGRARRFAMSEQTRKHLDSFWELVEDVFNVLLFLLLGLQIMVLPPAHGYILAGLLAIPIALIARWCSVTPVVGLLGVLHKRIPSSISILTWGGLRGGLAVALALSVPHTPSLQRNLLLFMTFVVVVFSVLVQGLSLPALLRRSFRTSTV